MPRVYNSRHPVTGEVVGPDPLEREAQVAVTTEWSADGGVSRTMKFEELTPDEVEIVKQLLEVPAPEDAGGVDTEVDPEVEKVDKVEKVEKSSDEVDANPAEKNVQPTHDEGFGEVPDHGGGMAASVESASDFKPGDRVTSWVGHGVVVAPQGDADPSSGYVSVMLDGDSPGSHPHQINEKDLQKDPSVQAAGEFNAGDQVRDLHSGEIATVVKAEPGRPLYIKYENGVEGYLMPESLEKVGTSIQAAEELNVGDRVKFLGFRTTNTGVISFVDNANDFYLVEFDDGALLNIEKNRVEKISESKVQAMEEFAPGDKVRITTTGQEGYIVKDLSDRAAVYMTQTGEEQTLPKGALEGIAKRMAHGGQCSPLKTEAIRILSDLQYEDKTLNLREYLCALADFTHTADMKPFAEYLYKATQSVASNPSHKERVGQLEQIWATLLDVQGKIDRGEVVVDKKGMRKRSILEDYGLVMGDRVVDTGMTGHDAVLSGEGEIVSGTGKNYGEVDTVEVLFDDGSSLTYSEDSKVGRAMSYLKKVGSKKVTGEFQVGEEVVWRPKNGSSEVTQVTVVVKEVRTDSIKIEDLDGEYIGIVDIDTLEKVGSKKADSDITDGSRVKIKGGDHVLAPLAETTGTYRTPQGFPGVMIEFDTPVTSPVTGKQTKSIGIAAMNVRPGMFELAKKRLALSLTDFQNGDRVINNKTGEEGTVHSVDSLPDQAGGQMPTLLIEYENQGLTWIDDLSEIEKLGRKQHA